MISKIRMVGKRILSVTICLMLTIVPALTGCGDENTSEAQLAAAQDTAEIEAAQDSDVNETEVETAEIQTPIALRPKHNYKDAKTVTVLCYVNGSDLETQSGEATGDISEIIDGDYNEDVRFVIQTMGTKRWDKALGIASDRSQRYLVKENKLELVDDSLGQLDCTKEETLFDFIKWGTEKYPADRYILHFWNHGGGPVIGFGVDEFQSQDASLTIDEMRSAIKKSGVFFDFVSMDCCIMSCLEVCYALADCCDYVILSEDFESGLGWDYAGWVSALSNTPSIDTRTLAKIAIDDTIRANETQQWGDALILSLIDEAMVGPLYKAWTNFAYANESTLLGTNYSQPVKRKKSINGLIGRMHPKMQGVSLSDYYITDMMAVSQNVKSDEANALANALARTLVYSNQTTDETTLTGMAISLPYGDSSYYKDMKKVFANAGIDETYVKWLSKFTNASGVDSYYDYNEWGNEWNGWSEWNCPDGNCGSNSNCPDGNCGSYYDCPDGNCGSYYNDCPNGNCGSYYNDCPDGNCGSYYDCPDGNCGSYYDCPNGNCGDYYDDYYDDYYYDYYYDDYYSNCPGGNCNSSYNDCPSGNCYSGKYDYLYYDDDELDAYLDSLSEEELAERYEELLELYNSLDDDCPGGNCW